MNLSKLLSTNKLPRFATVVVLSLLVIFSLMLKDPHQNSTIPNLIETTPVSQQNSVEPGLPKYIKIPSINVSANIESIGLTPQGDLDAPKNPNNAAWYNLGPKPGELGNSVIDGHFGLKDNVPAVFDNLAKLQKGDKIYIEDEAGISYVFVVRELQTYGPDEIVSSVFNSKDTEAHLNLITCGGAWDKTLKSYSNRLVVFTDKE